MTDHNNGTNGNAQNNLQKKEKETFVKDFKYYYSIMLNRWYWLALGLIAGLALFYFSIRYSTKQYKISGSVLIENTEEKSVSKEALTRELGFDKGESNMEDRIRVLGSTEIGRASCRERVLVQV